MFASLNVAYLFQVFSLGRVSSHTFLFECIDLSPSMHNLQHVFLFCSQTDRSLQHRQGQAFQVVFMRKKECVSRFFFFEVLDHNL